jgi:hypothetical protein
MGTGLNVAGNPVDSVENVHHVSGLGLRVLGDGERAMATLVTSICTERTVLTIARALLDSTHSRVCRVSTISTTPTR